MDMSKYQDIFVAESRENITALNKALLEFEKAPQNLGPLDEVFRAMHSIKGMSAAMGFEDLADFAHSTEDVMDQMRRQELPPSDAIIDILFQSFDALESFVDSIATEQPSSVDFLDLKSRLEKIASGATESAPEQAPASTPSVPSVRQPQPATTGTVDWPEYDLSVYLDQDCPMKGVRAFIVIKTLKEMGRVIRCTPSEKDLEVEKFDNSFTVNIQTEASPEEIERTILKIFDVDHVNIKSASERKKEIVPSLAKDKDRAAIQSKTKSVRVAIQHLDNLMNLVEELVLNRGRLERVTSEMENPSVTAIVEQLARLTTNMRDVVMQSRMVPASELFDRYPRLVRDTAKELGKDVEITIEGSEIELDRAVLDQINDPIVHLLRNAIDHGIETREERIQKGKAETGNIYISVSRERSNVLINVADDGKGLDSDVLRQKAVEKNIMSAEEAMQLSEEDTYMLITRPGFSTSSKVTDISGRGVGMDVVRTRIRRLGGSLSINSALNLGTQFGLRLPLTLAIIQALEVNVYGEIYVIPLTNILETMEITADDIRTIRREEVTVLRGEVVPLVRLGDVLEAPNRDKMGTNEFAAVIVEVGEKRRGLVVSKLVGQSEIVVKPLPGIINTAGFFAGVTILGDGRPSFILDVSSFL